MAYRLINCTNGQSNIDTSTDLSEKTGKIIQLLGVEGCFIVSGEITNPNALPHEVVACYDKCEDCVSYGYRLTSCTDPTFVRYHELDYEEEPDGKVVKGDIYGNRCLKIEKHVKIGGQAYKKINPFSHIYNSCTDCMPGRHAEPLPLHCEDRNIIENIECFFKKAYNNLIRKRYGIQTVSEEADVEKEVFYETWKHEANTICSPSFPEPTVTVCCIQVDPKKGCCECSDVYTEEDIIDVCTISVNHDHPCYKVTFNIDDMEIQNSDENDDTKKNNKVYYLHYPCGSTTVKTEEITEAGDYEFCSVGIPLLGYYRENKWLVLAYTRTTEVCEEETEKQETNFNCGCHE